MLCRRYFLANLTALKERFPDELQREKAALITGAIEQANAAAEALPWFGLNPQLSAERRRLHQRPATFPYRLFTLSFAGVYFGLEQCMAIDSLRYTFDILRDDNEINDDTHRWFCLALCVVLSRCTTSPGHFAQPLHLKERNKTRILRQRRRSIWSEWLRSLSELGPVGGRDWRARNLSFNQEANDLLSDIKQMKHKPSVIYADPPYTKDQYSRYYHVYETLLHYDYPLPQGTGRCRDDRAASDFSLLTRIDSALENLIAQAGELGCNLVLSYPKSGLLEDSFIRIPQMLSRHFQDVRKPLVIEHFHSAMGASKGVVRYAVSEVIYSANR